MIKISWFVICRKSILGKRNKVLILLLQMDSQCHISFLLHASILLQRSKTTTFNRWRTLQKLVDFKQAYQKWIGASWDAQTWKFRGFFLYQCQLKIFFLQRSKHFLLRKKIVWFLKTHYNKTVMHQILIFRWSDSFLAVFQKHEN